ncbi:hypothetical protein LJR153_006799 [Paenibacillus sp. LjRoot153]
MSRELGKNGVWRILGEDVYGGAGGECLVLVLEAVGDAASGGGDGSGSN